MDDLADAITKSFVSMNGDENFLVKSSEIFGHQKKTLKSSGLKQLSNILTLMQTKL